MNIPELLQVGSSKQDGFEKAKRLYQDRLAPDFSPFEFMDLNEMRLSSLLAWMLDPGATHGQGGRFLKLFLNRLGVVWIPDACDHAEVKTESWVEGGRLDIIASFGSKAVVIENKPWAADQPGQLTCYLAHLDRLMGDGTTLTRADLPLIYLTADGSPPSAISINEEEVRERIGDRQLRCWSYREHILEWLTQCRAECRADRVSVFIDEFARYIGKTFTGVSDMSMQERIAEEIIASSAMLPAAMQIILTGNVVRDKLLSKLSSQLALAVASEGWHIDGKLSAATFSRLSIDFSPQLGCVFRVEFEKPEFCDFIYGAAYREDRSRHDSAAIKEALRVIKGGRDSKYWPWWRYSSLQDELIPFERNWNSSPQPWLAIADGSMARAIIEAAHQFQKVMLHSQGNKPQSDGSAR